MTTEDHPQLPYALTQAERDVLDERRGQRTREGYDDAHDDKHTGCELTGAAVSYAAGALLRIMFPDQDLTSKSPESWPFEEEAWSPADPRRMLVKAGALIFAELDRIDRAEARKGGAE